MKAQTAIISSEKDLAEPTSRVYFIDWLRILAVLLLFPFHTLRVFDAQDPFYVKSSTLSMAITHLLDFISVWHMPLFFFVAGCSTYFALRKRRAGEYAWERVKRLLVPLVFGILILIPPQTWFGARFNSGYAGSFWHYLASGDFLRWNIQDSGDYFGGFGTGQLWFILFLFVISLIALPLVFWGVRGHGAGRMQAFGRRLARPMWWVLPIGILFVASIAPEIAGKNLVFYLAVFVLGYVSVCHASFMESALRYRVPALVAGLGLSLATVLTSGVRRSLPDPSLGREGLVLMGIAAMWLAVIGFLGFGKRYLNRTCHTQRYLGEASYPIYIIHQTVIVALAFYLVETGLPAGVQWLLLLVGTVLGAFALYEGARRVAPLRFLLGMRPNRRSVKQEETGDVFDHPRPQTTMTPAGNPPTLGRHPQIVARS
jgi:glucans biosynthesis protein C